MTCEWPVDRGCLPEPADDAALERQNRAIDMAVEVLWALSGRQFGVCDTVARPCPRPCVEPGRGAVLGHPGWLPVWDGGAWRNTSCGCSGHGCSAAGPRAVHLPGPVVSVEAVRLGDIELAPTEYVLEGDTLYRTDPASVWPSQDLNRPAGEPGTWTVTYRRGNPVPEYVGMLVGVLAKEFDAACAGGKCRLPRRVQSVTRQGVSYQMVDPTDIYRSGLTGIPEVDSWLSSVNPNRLQAAPRVR